jgi:hypothetical protein
VRHPLGYWCGYERSEQGNTGVHLRLVMRGSYMGLTTHGLKSAQSPETWACLEQHCTPNFYTPGILFSTPGTLYLAKFFAHPCPCWAGWRAKRARKFGMFVLDCVPEKCSATRARNLGCCVLVMRVKRARNSATRLRTKRARNWRCWLLAKRAKIL